MSVLSSTWSDAPRSSVREIFDDGWKSRRAGILPLVTQGSPEREITRAIVAIYKAYLDRGPVSARTVIQGDLVVCMLEGTLSKAEKRLAANDQADAVRDIRRTYQDAMREAIVSAVEGVTGRTAQAFLSDHDPGPDIAVEVVKLVAEARPDSSRNGDGVGESM